MVSMVTMSVKDYGFDPWSGQNNDYKLIFVVSSLNIKEKRERLVGFFLVYKAYRMERHDMSSAFRLLCQ